MRTLEAVAEAGFVYWGLFLAFAVILVGYLVWMWRSEVPDGRPREEEERAGGRRP